MTPFSNDGTIRQQGIQARNIARQAIAKAIAEEAERTGVLVSNIIRRITMNQLAPKSVEDLWNDIQMDGTLAMIQPCCFQPDAETAKLIQPGERTFHNPA